MASAPSLQRHTENQKVLLIMTWRWLTVQREVAVKSQNSAKAEFYVSMNVFNIKKTQ